jgi:enterochelin esterase-like enzyme
LPIFILSLTIQPYKGDFNLRGIGKAMLNKKIFLRTLILVVAISNISQAAWQTDLDSLLLTDNKIAQDSLINAIVTAKPNWLDVSSYIKHTDFPAMEKGKAILRQATCIDGVQRPWVVYVPSGYNPAKSTPLLIILHGAVMRPNIRDNPLKYSEDYPFTALAEKQGWLVLYPYGQAGATWWDKVGISNIMNQIRMTKRLYNVDDDRVWLGGFSDGGSAAYLLAMIAPSDFAAFLALNGDMGIGGRAGNIASYAANLASSNIYAINTTEDDHFPAAQVRKEIQFARKAGAQIFYKEYPGPHDFVYQDKEMPLFANYFERHVRDPFQSQLTWETADPAYGQCRWIVIDSLVESTPSSWHKDINLTMIDSSIVLGFQPDTSYKGNGLMVGRIVGGGNLAVMLGLRPGDIIVKVGSQEITNNAVFEKAKAIIKRGQDITMLVTRNSGELSLACHVPEPSSYELFTHNRLSGKVNASFSANRIDIESSRVGKLRVLIHPDMIRLDQALTIRLNGKTVFNKTVKPDLEYLLCNFLKNRDRKLLYVAEVELR